MLRLVDLVVLAMDDDGSLTRVEIADEDFGDLLIADAQLDPADVFAMFEGRGVHVLQSERAQALAQSLVPGSGLALILVEHQWARSLFDSIADLGGVVFSEGFIGERAEELVSVQLAALEDTARVIDAAYAAQTRRSGRQPRRSMPLTRKQTRRCGRQPRRPMLPTRKQTRPRWPPPSRRSSWKSCATCRPK